MAPSILPFIHARGSWGEIGLQVGVMFAPSIERHVEAYIGNVMRAERRGEQRHGLYYRRTRKRLEGC